VRYSDLLLQAMPEALLTGAALLVLLADLTLMRRRESGARRWVAGLGLAFGCVLALAWLAWADQPVAAAGSLFVTDSLTQLVKQDLLGLTICTALVSIESRFTDHVGEFYLLLALATVGMLCLVSSANLLMLFVSLELLSLCLYAMVAFNKQSQPSAESALKYFFFGGMSAAILLFGLSLLYGMSGSLDLARIADRLRGPALDPLLAVALVMIAAGLGFKIAAAPFHLWAPDTYQGAPAPVAAFIASGTKVASFFVLARVLMLGLVNVEGSAAWRHFAQGWYPIIAVLALLSMIVGNLAALAQTSVRRLLAYSAVAHAGYALLALLASREQGVASLLFFVFTYALTVLGAFAVVAAVQEGAGTDSVSAFAGLGRRSPLLAFCLLVFMLSLAGIPPLAGFFGKFYVFTTTAGSGPRSLGLLWLVIVAIGMSAVSLYYYLQVLKQVYVVEAPAEPAVVPASALTRVVVAGLALAIVLFGCLPHLLLGRITTAIRAAGF
jgi:NADH-quinone oxidoreductase subunit N